MQNSNVQPFVEASRYVVKTVTGMDFSIGEIIIRKRPYFLNDIAVVIGFFGDYEGQFTISMNMSLAKEISSKMTGIVLDGELDEFARSALAELSNMIFGHASSLLYNLGIFIDITPPSVLVGQKILISVDKMDTSCIPLKFGEIGTIEFNIAFLLPESKS